MDPFTLVFAISLIVIGGAIAALTQPKPSKPSPAALDDFQFPQPDEGTPHPVIFGEVWTSDWFVLYYGNFRTAKVKKDDQTIGFKYFMSIHMGLCRGPIDALVQIKVGDLSAWYGTALTADTAGFAINAPWLFGGDEKEGGIQGTCALMMGSKTQVPPSWVVATLGGNVPGFRGISTMFFDGEICSISAYPKTWKMRIRRSINGWDGTTWHPELAALSISGFVADNPAHIIYECLTNRDWGRGFDRSLLDDTAFLQSAQTLANEGFGLCLSWNRQDSIQTFIQMVIDHVGGALYIDRLTGLIVFKLVRADYDPSSLPVVDYNSGLIEITEGDTTARDNAVNEIIVNWHEPISDQDRQIRVQDLASIQSLGCINTQTTDYKGLPTAELATRVAQRDLRVNVSALKKYSIKLDRRGWRLAPAALIRVSAPDKGLSNVIVRVGKVSDGDITDGTISVEAVIDVFGLPSVAFVSDEPSAWTPPDATAAPVGDRFVREMTYREAFEIFSSSQLAALASSQGAVLTMASAPTALSLSYDVATEAGAETSYAVRGNAGFAPAASLAADIGVYDTSITLTSIGDLTSVVTATAAQIGSEIVRIDAIGDTSLTIARGCVDTVPVTHVAGTRIYFFDEGYGSDGRTYSTGTTVNVKALTRTSRDLLAVGAAPVDSLTVSGRQGRPYPPAKLLIGTTPFANVTSVTGNVIFNWVERNRITQQDSLISHSEANVAGEAGTSYVIRIFKPADLVTPVRTTEVTTTTWIYTTSMQTTDAVGASIIVEIESKRDGLTSAQMYHFTLART
jgi:hypothetical protein